MNVAKLLLAFIIPTFFIFSAQADFYAECGYGIDKENDQIINLKFSISTTMNDDQFSGSNGVKFSRGEEWNMGLTPNRFAYLAPKRATAKMTKTGKKSFFEFSVISVAPSFGRKYVYGPIGAKKPHVDVINIGGFAGGSKVETYPDCLFSED